MQHMEYEQDEENNYEVQKIILHVLRHRFFLNRPDWIVYWDSNDSLNSTTGSGCFVGLILGAIVFFVSGGILSSLVSAIPMALSVCIALIIGLLVWICVLALAYIASESGVRNKRTFCVLTPRYVVVYEYRVRGNQITSLDFASIPFLRVAIDTQPERLVVREGESERTFTFPDGLSVDLEVIENRHGEYRKSLEQLKETYSFEYPNE